jgi:phospholipid/cholesterol/gamma-HCH transport system substrate-binding protein
MTKDELSLRLSWGNIAATMDGEHKRSELMVGLFLLAGLAMMGLLVLQFGNIKGLTRGKYSLYVTYPSAEGITSRTHVRLGGAKVGMVRSSPQPNKDFTAVQIELLLFDDVLLPEGSSFSIATLGLMGDAYISISPPAVLTGRTIPPGTEIVGTTGMGFAALQSTAEDLGSRAADAITEMQKAVTEIQDSLAKINQGILTQDNVAHISQTLESAAASAATLDQEILAPANAAALRETLDQLQQAASSLQSSTAKLDAAMDQFGPAVGEASLTFTSARSAMEKAGTAFEQFGQTAESTAAAAKELELLLAQAQYGDGLVTALLHDESLRADFTNLIHNLRRRGVVLYKDYSKDPGYVPQLAPTRAPVLPAAEPTSAAGEPDTSRSWLPWR